MARLEITMGLTAPHLSEQLRAAGIDLAGGTVDLLDRDMREVSRLQMRRVLQPLHARMARDRILRRLDVLIFENKLAGGTSG